MRSSLLVIAAVIAVVQLLSGSESLFTAQAEVVDLTQENFYDLVTVNEAGVDWLIMFYAPWCEYSQKLAPNLDDAARMMEFENIRVGKVNVAANKKLGTKFDITGFPTVKMYHLGATYTFKGRRSPEEMVEFARGGYQIHTPESVRADMGLIGDVLHIYHHAKRQAAKDLMEGSFLTVDLYLTFLPIVGVLLIFLVMFYPLTVSPEYAKQLASKTKRNQSQSQSQSMPSGGQQNNRSNMNTNTNANNKNNNNPDTSSMRRRFAPPTAKTDTSVL